MVFSHSERMASGKCSGLPLSLISNSVNWPLAADPRLPQNIVNRQRLMEMGDALDFVVVFFQRTRQVAQGFTQLAGDAGA